MESLASRAQRSGAKSHRKPLQPRNSLPVPIPKSHPKPKAIQTSALGSADPGKENRPITSVGPELGPTLEASLAEELGAVRRWRERLRAERERTERLLRERDLALEREMSKIERRGEEQRRLELEILTVIRLMDFKSCARSSPFQSLREREQEKRHREAQLQVTTTRSNGEGALELSSANGNGIDD